MRRHSTHAASASAVPAHPSSACHDALTGAARRRTARGGSRGRSSARERASTALAVETHEPVPAELDRLHPLGRVPQRQAGHLEQVGLLLHARPSRSAPRAHASEQRQEVEVAERRCQHQTCRRAPTRSSAPVLSSRARVRGWTGKTAGSGSDSQQLDERAAAARRSSTLPARCAVTSRYDPCSRPSRSSTSELRSADRRHHQRHVRHHVADQPHAVVDRPRRTGCATAVGVEHSSSSDEVIGQDAVALLGHRVVERPHARLDVRQRQPDLGRRQRSRQRACWCRRRRARRPASTSAATGSSALMIADSCSRVVTGADPELACSGAGRSKLAKEHRGQFVVVVLAGVDKRLSRDARAARRDTAAAFTN